MADGEFSYLDEAFVGGASGDLLGIPGASQYESAIPAGAVVAPDYSWDQIFNGGDIAAEAEKPAPAAGVQYQPGFWGRTLSALADVVETGTRIVDMSVRAVRDVRGIADQPAPVDPRRATPAPAGRFNIFGLSGLALAAVLVGAVLVWRGR